jgi:iduronate 2-sulfatase
MRTDRREFLKSAGLLAGTILAGPQFVFAGRTGIAGRKMNVLFLLVDDLRPTMRAWGDKVAITPNLDKLSGQSRNFKRTYIQQAVCGPSRSSMLTGLLPDHTRVWHNRNLFRDHIPDTVTLPQHFMKHGYFAQGMGKVFSGNPRREEQEPASWSVEPMLKGVGEGWDNYALSENANPKGGKGTATECADLPDDAYKDGRLAELAVETLSQYKQKQTQPFFLAVGFSKPHLPFNAPKKYWDIYNPEDFLPIPKPGRVLGAPDLAYWEHRELGGYKDITKNEDISIEKARHLRHGYYACVSYVDAQIGKVLDALKKNEMEDNTIIVLWGDHGYSLGEQGRWCKSTNFEMDTRVPLMMRTPGMPDPGASTDSIVEAVDIYPTLAELAGLAAPVGLDGTSFASIVQDPKRPGKDIALSQFARPFKPTDPEYMGYSIRTSDGYRYNRWVEWSNKKTVHEELYYYGKRQYDEVREWTILIEVENLIDHPKYSQVRNRLRNRMDRLLKERLGWTDIPQRS